MNPAQKGQAELVRDLLRLLSPPLVRSVPRATASAPAGQPLTQEQIKNLTPYRGPETP